MNLRSQLRPPIGLLSLTILLAASLPAAGDGIYGRVEPARLPDSDPIRLVHSLDPDDLAALQDFAETFRALSASGYDLNDRPFAPANRPVLLERIQKLDSMIPSASSRSIRLGTTGMRVFSTSESLIQRYRETISGIPPEGYAEGLESLATRLSADLRSLRFTIAGGFVDEATAVELLGVRSTGTRADLEGAAVVGQAIVNLDWLVTFAGAFGSALPELRSPVGLTDPESSPEAAWDLFRIHVLPDLLNRIEIATINRTRALPDGRFALRGEGIILVRVLAFGTDLYFPEGTPGTPFQIQRIQP